MLWVRYWILLHYSILWIQNIGQGKWNYLLEHRPKDLRLLPTYCSNPVGLYSPFNTHTHKLSSDAWQTCDLYVWTISKKNNFPLWLAKQTNWPQANSWEFRIIKVKFLNQASDLRRFFQPFQNEKKQTCFFSDENLWLKLTPTSPNQWVASRHPCGHSCEWFSCKRWPLGIWTKKPSRETITWDPPFVHEKFQKSSSSQKCRFLWDRGYVSLPFLGIPWDSKRLLYLAVSPRKGPIVLLRILNKSRRQLLLQFWASRAYRFGKLSSFSMGWFSWGMLVFRVSIVLFFERTYIEDIKKIWFYPHKHLLCFPLNFTCLIIW